LIWSFMNRLQVLLSAMHLENENYIDSLNIVTDAVVINQCDREEKRDGKREAINGALQKVTYIETLQRGLSKSRNMAIRNATADICILCDNDVEYQYGYEGMILRAFESQPDADIIVFFIKRKERLSPIFDEVKKMNYLSVLKIFSPEIAFRRKSVLDTPFDEEFGAGAKYKMGEENLFLYDCLKKKKKIVYMPIQIAALREEESTWFSGYDKEFFLCRGANYVAMSRWFSHVLIWQFALRKKSLYGKNAGMFKVIKWMYEGRREYESLHRGRL